MVLLLHPSRQVGNELYEMQITLHFDIRLLKFSIPYKYIILSPSRKQKDDEYEYIQSPPSHSQVIFNRCLVIPNRLLFPEGTYIIMYLNYVVNIL